MGLNLCWLEKMRHPRQQAEIARVDLQESRSPIPLSARRPPIQSTYWEEPPSSALGSDSTVARRWCFSVDLEPAPPIRILPDGELSILFSAPRGGRHWEATVYGATTRPRIVHQPESRIQIQVKIVPGRGCGLLGNGLHELRDQAIPLDCFWGRRSDRLLTGLAQSISWRSRRDRLERAFTTSQSAPTAASELVRQAVGKIQSDHGRRRVFDVAKSLGVAQRKLERAFASHLGLSPKLYARIIRFRIAQSQIEAEDDYATVAASAGYSDHAHMTREFRVFAGAPPSALGSLILANTIDKPDTRRDLVRAVKPSNASRRFNS